MVRVREHILWRDATSFSGWYSNDDLSELTCDEVVTQGYVIKETKKEIIIAHSFSEDEWIGILSIPKGWIISREEI